MPCLVLLLENSHPGQFQYFQWSSFLHHIEWLQPQARFLNSTTPICNPGSLGWNAWHCHIEACPGAGHPRWPQDGRLPETGGCAHQTLCATAHMIGPAVCVLWPPTEASRDHHSVPGGAMTPGPPVCLSCPWWHTVGPVYVWANHSAVEAQTGVHRRRHPHQSTHLGYHSQRVAAGEPPVLILQTQRRCAVLVKHS